MSLLSILFFLALYLPVAPSLESTGNTRLTVGFVETYICSRGSEPFNSLKTPRGLDFLGHRLKSGRRSLLGAKCSEGARGENENNNHDKAHVEPRIGSAPFIHARHDGGRARVGLPAPLTVRWIHASIAMHQEILANGFRQHNERTTCFLPRIGSSPFIKARRDSSRGPHLAHATTTVNPEAAKPQRLPDLAPPSPLSASGEAPAAAGAEAAMGDEEAERLLGSRRLHSAVTMLADPVLAEEHSGGDQVFGSRRLAALATILRGDAPPPSSPPAASLEPVGAADAPAAAALAEAPAVEPGPPAVCVVEQGRDRKEADIDAPPELVYAVAADLAHYSDWAGDGIQSVVVRLQEERGGRGYAEAVYRAGAFGYMFDFVLAFTMTPGRHLAFRMLESSAISKLEGSYALTSAGDGRTHLSFELSAELGNFIPSFIQRSIANMVMAIAVNELRKYAETPRCRAALTARGLI